MVATGKLLVAPASRRHSGTNPAARPLGFCRKPTGRSVTEEMLPLPVLHVKQEVRFTHNPSLERARQSVGNPPRNCLPCHPMTRETVVDSRQEILRTAARLSGGDPRREILPPAARLFQQRGYDATSMNDVAAALKLSKGGLYHHFQSKDEILFEIMNHAMDITEERVLNPVRTIGDADERLRALIRLHIEVVLSPRDREITVMLHENHPLPPSLRKRINSRKKDYIHFLENLMAEVQGKSRSGQQARGKVTPRAAAFALLGMINWIYQWYKPEGELQAQNLIPQFTELIFGGIFA